MGISLCCTIASKNSVDELNLGHLHVQVQEELLERQLHDHRDVDHRRILLHEALLNPSQPLPPHSPNATTTPPLATLETATTTDQRQEASSPQHITRQLVTHEQQDKQVGREHRHDLGGHCPARGNFGQYRSVKGSG